MEKHSAFTLAETLITLGIIGVIAAITLPVLTNNINSIIYKNQLKSAYSIIQNGFDRMTEAQGEKITPRLYGGQNDFYPVYKKYFHKIVDCGYSNPDQNLCMSRADAHESVDGGHNDLVYKSFNGNVIDTDNFDDGQFILPNGMLIMIQSHGTVFISVDINGKKKGPNRLGQDVFTFQVTNSGKLVPMGAVGTTYSNANNFCSKTSTSSVNGIGCTYKALTEKDFFKKLPK